MVVPSPLGGKVDVRILGPFEVWDGGRSLKLGGLRPRALLAMLALRAGEVVSVDRLVDDLWGGAPPRSAQHLLHVYVSVLRKALVPAAGRTALVTRAPGYVLELGADELDARRFERLLSEGRKSLAAGDAEESAAILGEALSLWRGPALADFAYEPFAQAEIARLEELRLVAREVRVEADLALGGHHELVGELEAVVGEHPLRERPRAQLMLALYRCGRQAEALESYRDARRILVDELGIEPGPELRRLEQAILRQDESLGSPASREAPVPGRRKPLVPAIAAAAAGALVLVPVLGGASRVAGRAALARSPAVAVGPNSVAVIHPSTNRIAAAVRVGREPGPVAVGAGTVWVANVADESLSRIEAPTRRVVATIPLGIEPTGLAVGAGTVWVAGGRNSQLVAIDAATNRIRERIDLGEVIGPLPVGYERGRSGVAVGEGAVWVAHGEEVTRIDPVTRAVVATIPAGGNWSGAIAAGEGAVWVAENGSLKTREPRSGLTTAITRIDPTSNVRTETIPVHGLKPPTTGAALSPGAIAVGEGAVWAAATAADVVWRIASGADRVRRTIPGGDEPASVAVGDGAVWVENHADQTVVRIDPFSNARVATVQIGRSTRGIAVGSGAVWVTAVR